MTTWRCPRCGHTTVQPHATAAWHAGCPATGRSTPLTPQPESDDEAS